MEPPAAAPQLYAAAAAATTTTASLPAPPHLSYPDSVDSSPRSRTTDTSEAGAGDPLPQVPGGGKLRLMCSFGGQIAPRPQDKSLSYVGGETRIVVVDRNSTLPEILQRLSKTLLNSRSFTLKYQLPNEDLDSLITVSTEEDLENMIEEYDRLIAGSNPAKPSRIRLFLFPTKLEVAASMGPILDGSNKSDEWFLNALNSADDLQRGFSEPASVNCLLGLEVNGSSSGDLDPNSKEDECPAVVGEGMGVGLCGGKGKVGNLSNQDVRFVHDSPILETNSSFGSTSSSPSLANLPPIRVHVEEGVGGGGGPRVFDQRFGVEEQFAQMGVSVPKQDEGFVMMSSPPTVTPNLPVSGVMAGVPAIPAGEYTNRIVSDDERSDHGVPVGDLKMVQPPPLLAPSSQAQPKQIIGDLPSPDSVSSDSSLSNSISRQKPVIYQDPPGQVSSGSNRVPASFTDPKMVVADTGPQAQIQQVAVMPPQYDQLLHQSIQSQQLQLPQKQLLQQQQQQQQQLFHASNQYVHPHPVGGVPVSYYPVHSSEQPHHHHQIDQRYPVYYMPSGQAHAYNLSVQQPNYVEAANVVPSSQPQTLAPNPNLITSTASFNTTRDEIAQPGVYMTATAATPQLLQVPSQQQQQFVVYSQIHHPSLSIAPTSASASTYAYDLTDPAHAQRHFTQPLAPQLAAQYQTVTSAPKMMLSDASSALPTDNVKLQMRTSQAL